MFIFAATTGGEDAEAKPVMADDTSVQTEDLVGDGKIQQTLMERWARLKGVWFDDSEAYLSRISQVRDGSTEGEVFTPDNALSLQSRNL